MRQKTAQHSAFGSSCLVHKQFLHRLLGAAGKAEGIEGCSGATQGNIMQWNVLNVCAECVVLICVLWVEMQSPAKLLMQQEQEAGSNPHVVTWSPTHAQCPALCLSPESVHLGEAPRCCMLTQWCHW